MIADLKRQNQKLHEENVQLKLRIEEGRVTMATQHSRPEFRNKLHTH
jgi:hypothetical protein